MPNIRSKEPEQTLEQTFKETLKWTLERRYRSRVLSRRYAKENAKKADSKGRAEEAAEFQATARQHLGSCGEIGKLARDLGANLDFFTLNKEANELADEIEETLRRFETRRARLRDEGGE